MSDFRIADVELTEMERRLLNDFQRGFPLTDQPYAFIANKLGVTEEAVISCLQSLSDRGVVSRIGPVIRPKCMGSSTLAAISVPGEHLWDVADLVSSFPEVNHNYEREHEINLWFVVTAPSEFRLHQVLKEIEYCTGFHVYNLPMLESYHIDLGFQLWC